MKNQNDAELEKLKKHIIVQVIQ
ncbi:MAG: hypothetical protein RLZZ196_2771, partial [Bacteroidota bacterium]